MTRRERIYMLQRVLDVWTLRGNRWVQGSYGISNGGLHVSHLHPAAVGYCIDGALQLVYAEHALTWDQLVDLRTSLILTLDLDTQDPFALEHWNDEPRRTFADVRRALETAIELER